MAHRTSFPHQYKSALAIRLHVINHVHSNVIYGAQNAAECAWKKEHKKKMQITFDVACIKWIKNVLFNIT